MRGIIGYGAHVPHRRLERGEVAAFFGGRPGKGSRSVASYDEDTTTMAVEASRNALRGALCSPDAVWFSTATPAYAERTNATTLHAALGLSAHVPAFDFAGAVRSGAGALVSALSAGSTCLVAAADQRGGLPGSEEEGEGGDAGAALLVGDSSTAPLLAEHLGSASRTIELLDRWRAPGEVRTRSWDERFAEVSLVPVALRAWEDALKGSGLDAADVHSVVLTGPQRRVLRALRRRLGVDESSFVDDLAATVGWTGTAHPALMLASALETLPAGAVVAVVSVADGADVVLLRTTEAAPVVAAEQGRRSVSAQVGRGAAVPYAKYLSWRGLLETEPPRRPEPARTSASAAARSSAWKFGFVASKDRSSGALHMPPARISMEGGAVDEMDPVQMADAEGTIVTFTVDRLAYSPSPPVVFAVVDFDAGGRLPIELTDVDEGEVAIGGRVEMSFRRLGTADGIHNYFWKARPVRA